MAALGMMTAGTPGSTLRRFLDRFFPEPGEGPSKEQREAGFFKFVTIGKFANGDTLRASVTGDRDPGYGSTSRMLGESAACLALDARPDSSLCGVVTPSTAMGESLLKRLEGNAGLEFSLG
jgi:short subunit dehydrogenase-like uncharacterized protein